LLAASIYSWTVILGKISTFRKATRDSRKFVRAFRKATKLQEIATLATECAASPLAQVFEDVYETYKRQTGGVGPPRSIVPLERTAQTSGNNAVNSLERRMTWLATIASTSPLSASSEPSWALSMRFTDWVQQVLERCVPWPRALPRR